MNRPEREQDSAESESKVGGEAQVDEEARVSERRTRKNGSQTVLRESVVYLTADTEEELSELKEGETYIIGGICDHNRYKVCALQFYTDSS